MPASAFPRSTRRPAHRWTLGLGIALAASVAGGVSAQTVLPAAGIVTPVPAPASSASASATATATATATASAVPGGEAAGLPAPVNAARALVRLFFEACVANGGSYQGAVDVAIAQGLTPQDLEAAGARALLGDLPGAVFRLDASDSAVLLAVAERGPCLLWADRAHGPGVRLAVQAALGERAARGDRLEVEADRKIEHTQAWRQQTLWRLRPAGAAAALQIGLVSTLTDAPAPQVLRAQIAPASPAFAPDGLPLR